MGCKSGLWAKMITYINANNQLAALYKKLPVVRKIAGDSGTLGRMRR